MGETSQFQVVAERWQASLGLQDADFARRLGRTPQEWSYYRTRERRPSIGFVRVVLAKAPEPWKSALEKAHLADMTVPA